MLCFEHPIEVDEHDSSAVLESGGVLSAVILCNGANVEAIP